MASNTARIHVGRLLEIRIDAGYRTVKDVDDLFDAVGREVGRLPRDQRHVTVVDWRRCPVMSPEAADHLGKHMSKVNASTERSAALARSDSPVAVLQFLRVIREAGFRDRKLFFDEGELTDWLRDTLSPRERARLHQFVREDATGA